MQSKPRQEVRACDELQKQGFEVFLPILKVEKVERGRRIQKDEVLFPRYLFLKLNEINDSWGPLRSTRGVTGLVHFGASYPSLSSEQFKVMKNWVTHLPKKDSFVRGQPVHIISGPFSGMQGIFYKLLESDDGFERALILFEMLGKMQGLSFSLADFRRS